MNNIVYIDNDKIDNDDTFKIFCDIKDIKVNDDDISITKVEISPNEKYLVTYSHFNNSFVGWNIKDISKDQLELDNTIKINEQVKSFCVSDDKKLVYICIDYYYHFYDKIYGK
jgi:hypothetical protein